MSTKKPLISIIIPHRESEQIEASHRALERAASHAKEHSRADIANYELLAVSGNQPSVQRNAAVKKARGDYVYFLDNDSIPSPESLLRIVSFFESHPRAAIIGGPSLTPETDTSSQRAFGEVLGSFLGTAFIRARYSSFGNPRVTSDRELILCNLAIRREVFNELGGFDERLYPNEENALMDEARRRGWELWHDPELKVWRSQRENFRAFRRQLFGYGRGRAEQMRLAPLKANLTPFVFMFFPLAVLGLIPVFLICPRFAWLWLAYPGLTLLASLRALRQGVAVFLKAWSGFFVCHLFYGLGLWAGLIMPLKSRKTKPYFKLRVIR